MINLNYFFNNFKTSSRILSSLSTHTIFSTNVRIYNSTLEETSVLTMYCL